MFYVLRNCTTMSWVHQAICELVSPRRPFVIDDISVSKWLTDWQCSLLTTNCCWMFLLYFTIVFFMNWANTINSKRINWNNVSSCNSFVHHVQWFSSPVCYVTLYSFGSPVDTSFSLGCVIGRPAHSDKVSMFTFCSGTLQLSAVVGSFT